MVDGALQHALETQGRLRIALVGLRQHRHGFGNDRTQVAAEFLQVRAAGAQHLDRGRVLEQREQQVLDRHEFMALLAGLLVALADGEL